MCTLMSQPGETHYVSPPEAHNPRSQLNSVSPGSCTGTAIPLEEYTAGSAAGIFVVCLSKVTNYCYAAVTRKFPLPEPSDGAKWFSKW